MAFHAGSGPSAMIDMSEGNPIRISVQQGFDDPSIAPDDALATQVSAASVKQGSATCNHGTFVRPEAELDASKQC